MASIRLIAEVFLLVSTFSVEAQVHTQEGIMLVGGTSSQGYIQMTYNGRSGLLCSEGIGHEEGQVICRDLGLPSQYPSILSAHPGAGKVILGSHVHCRGDEIKLSDCRHDSWNAQGLCHTGEASFISCQSDPCVPSPCQNGGQCNLVSSELGYSCNCTSGWGGTHCSSDVNECAVNNGGCGDQCVNTAGSYECHCASSYLQLAPDNHTCIVPGEQVTCGSHAMELTFEKASFPSLHPEHLTLRDTSCVATENATHIILRAPLTSCGTVSQQQGSQMVYHNIAKSMEEVVDGVISRVTEVDIPFQCLMDLSTVQEIPVSVDSQDLHFLLQGTGSHDVDMHFSTDGHFTPGQGQVSVYPGQEVYGQVTLSTLDPNLGVTLTNCSATPNLPHNYTDTPYEILQNGCGLDTTIAVDNATDHTVQTFHLEAFKFLNSAPQVALHCDLTLCDLSDPSTPCLAGCRHSA